MPPRPKHLKPSKAFPKLKKKSNAVTSDQDPDYNCIAFAAGVTNLKYWPTWHPDFAWPNGVPKQETLDAFKKFYELFGYTISNNGDFVEGIEKIAIYTDAAGKPKHAARQIDQKWWTSKLGNSFDIHHLDDAVSGGDYGEIATFMQRTKTS